MQLKFHYIIGSACSPLQATVTYGSKHPTTCAGPRPAVSADHQRHRRGAGPLCQHPDHGQQPDCGRDPHVSTHVLLCKLCSACCVVGPVLCKFWQRCRSGTQPPGGGGGLRSRPGCCSADYRTAINLSTAAAAEPSLLNPDQHCATRPHPHPPRNICDNPKQVSIAQAWRGDDIINRWAATTPPRRLAQVAAGNARHVMIVPVWRASRGGTVLQHKPPSTKQQTKLMTRFSYSSSPGCPSL